MSLHSNNKLNLAATGTTGNNTHTAIAVPNYDAVVFQFVVEAVGGTPTVTFKFQGSVDGTNWYDVGYITDATDGISQATRTVTAVGASVAFLSNPAARKYGHFRLVTTSNTNVTYRGEMYVL